VRNPHRTLTRISDDRNMRAYTFSPQIYCRYAK
jgi:hypothetical protein